MRLSRISTYCIFTVPTGGLADTFGLLPSVKLHGNLHIRFNLRSNGVVELQRRFIELVDLLVKVVDLLTSTSCICVKDIFVAATIGD